MKSLLIPAHQPLDQQWFDQLVAIAHKSLEVYTWLGPTQDQLTDLYEDFLHTHMTQNPDLRTQNLDLNSVNKEREQLVALAAKIDDEETNETVRVAYAARINELIVNLDILLAASSHDSAHFISANEEIYGQPDAELYAAAGNWLLNWAEANTSHEDHAIMQAAHDVLRALPAFDQIDPAILTPSAKLFTQIQNEQRNAADGFFATIFQGTALPPPDTFVTQVLGDQLIVSLLRNIQADGYTLTDSSDNYWSVPYEVTTVVRPREYRLPYPEFIGTVAHEIGSHLLERINGKRQPLRLLGIGLDRYECGNEGRALIREQVAYDSWESFAAQPRWLEVILRYFAIAHAHGTASSPSHSFAETFAVLLPIYTLANKLHKTTDATYQTWTLLIRVLNGTDGQGGAYLKDMVYLQGNMACWNTLEHQSELMTFGDCGKFDISNPRHLAILHNIAAK